MVFGGHLIFARSIQPGSKSKSVRSPRVAEFETIRLFLRPSLDETIGPAILHRNIYTFTLGSRGLVFVLGENGLAAHFFQLFAGHIFPQLGSVWSGLATCLFNLRNVRSKVRRLAGVHPSRHQVFFFCKNRTTLADSCAA